MQTTPNLGLKKPESNEYVNVADINENADTIDLAIGKITPLDADMFVYVATTGSNTTGDGTSGNPYETITYALSTIPKVLNGNLVTINLADGVYDEHVFVYGFTSGALKIQSTTPDSINTNCIVQSMLMQYCYASVDIRGITMSEPENENAIGIEVANNVSVSFVRSVRVNSSRSCIVCSKSDVAVFNCELSNHKYAIYANDSHVRSRNNTGISNSVALASTGGSVFTREGQQPAGTMPYDVYEGSTIVSSYGARIGTLANDVTLYVATTGSDTTGDGTSAKPYKTIMYALNSLPRDLGGYNANINIAAGAYDEDLSFTGLGQSGAMTFVLEGNITVRSISLAYSDVIFRSSNDSLARTLTTKYVFISNGSSFNAYSTVYITTTGYYEDGPSKYSFFIVRQSAVYVSGITTLTGNTGAAVVLASNSTAYFYSTTGSGFATGFDVSASSKLTVYSNTISATLPTSIYAGGQIIHNNGTQISNIITSGMYCTWGTLTGGYVKHGIFTGGVAMVTVQLRVVITTNLTAGTTYSIPGFPSSVSIPAVPLVSHRAQVIETAWIESPGTLKVQFKVNIFSGDTFFFGGTYLTNS